MPKLIRITTVPLSLKLLLAGQMKFMKASGWEVIMVSSDGKEVNEVVKKEGCEHRVIPFTRKITPFRDIYCIWLLMRLFKEVKPDIVHTHTPKAGFLGMIAAKLSGVPVRVHTLAGLPYVSSEKQKRSLLVAVEKFTFKMCTELWPNSFSLKKFILEEKLVDASKVRVLGAGSSNGVNLSQYARDELKENHLVAAMMRVAPGENDFIMLAVGRLVKDKGIEELVEAFLQSKIVNKSKLVLLGSFEQDLDPLREDIIRKINDHPRIVHVEWTDHVAHYMAISDVLVHPSHREGFPNVLLEAGAIHCPIICSDIPGNTELVKHQKMGLVFPVGNTSALKEAMEFAFVKKETMYGFAENLYEKVNENFDREKVHQLILQHYQLLLHAKSQSTSLN
ncbi:MAG TPA: glycosyltransferase family 4 protein [Cyclobacteriaceae bacterium]|nr:glycosyltransferase family 4 protein [Cyclobacteriaceae bacterium]